jgi:glycosyltransferase involved in cell wall biosynthesis
MDPTTHETPAASVAILSPGTSQFDSRAHRVARSLVARGHRVTIYSRRRGDLPREEALDGYRIVRIPLGRSDEDATRAVGSGPSPAAGTRPQGVAIRVRRAIGRARSSWLRYSDRVAVVHRFRTFPLRPMGWARSFERRVEPHDIWHGMWAGSLPALGRVRGRHGGHTVYDPRDVYLRSLHFGDMPRWQRALITPFERRWAQRADAVIQVSEPYAAMTRRDLGLRDVPVVRNCPDRWDPPTPRPDRIRERLGLSPEQAVVLYQGGLLPDRGIEPCMDAIQRVPGAVLVLMGFGNQEARLRELVSAPPHLGRTYVIDAVSPQELLSWSASSDVMVMCYPPDTENHRFVTPQKLWEAMAAGVPVLASDTPGFASVIDETGCGMLCDATDPGDIARALRAMLELRPEGLRAMGDRGLAAAHETYNWERQFEVLSGVYERLTMEDR